MKILKWISLLVLLTLTLAACALSAAGPSDASTTRTPAIDLPASAEPASSAPVPATSGPKGGAEPQAALVARQTLAQQLGVSPEEIQIIKAEKTDWPDSCLGIQVQGMMCAQVIVPGYLVVLEHAGKQYVFHTDETGGDVRLAEAPEPQVGQAVLTWHREGGIAGFCDDLLVYISGNASASSCKGSQPEPLGQGNLTADQLSQLRSWVDSLKSFEVDQKDPATADAMSIRLVFQGMGSKEPTDADKTAILNFASQLYTELAQAGPASTPTENPQQALTEYFNALTEGRFADAANFYGGSYEVLAQNNKYRWSFQTRTGACSPGDRAAEQMQPVHRPSRSSYSLFTKVGANFLFKNRRSTYRKGNQTALQRNSAGRLSV